MNKLRNIITLLALLLLAVPASAAMTAPETVAAAARRISSASGLTASFSVAAGGSTIKGSIKASGKKFALVTPQASSWYDGTNLYTYNASSRETTLVRPSLAELEETNPLSIIASAPGRFDAKFAAKQTAGSSTVVLTPKKAGSGIKRAVLVLDAKTLAPKKIDITQTDGSSSVITVTAFKTGVNLPASSFVYPKAKYPAAKIVDLR